ncbi:MAG TPA: AAA family ATPase, partial [bacterium]|nr:AAA family ATPase [bacterium]
MDDFPLLSTKLHIPPVRQDVVSRSRLVERLDKGLDTRLTLISAPAGFGKTTVLSEWIHQKQIRVGWYSIDPSDNDPLQFFAYLLAGLQQIQEGIGESILYMLRSPRHPPLKSLLLNLMNELDTVQAACALVLDDYHVIENNQIHALLEAMLEHLPEQVHLYVASRADPPISLARLRSQRQITEIRVDELSFTRKEAAAFFHRMLSRELS